MPRVAIAVMVATAALAWPARAAAAKPDTVVMINGDVTTCEVKSLSRGQLRVSTDDQGTLTIKWDKVVSVTTAGLYDIALTDGTRLVGRLDAAPGQQLSIIDGGGALATVPLYDVVSLAQIRARFFQKIDGSLDVGASYAQSSGVSQSSFNGNATYRQPGYGVTLRGSSTVTSEPEEDVSTRASAFAGYTRFLPERWLIGPLFLFESNRDLGFETRYTGALTGGRYLLQTNRGLMLVAGGLALGREQPVDAEAVLNVDGIATFEGSLFKYDYPKTNIDLTFQAFPGLNHWGRIRLNTNLTFRREIFPDVSFAISAYDNYDNRPEAVDARTNDVGYSLSLGWTF